MIVKRLLAYAFLGNFYTERAVWVFYLIQMGYTASETILLQVYLNVVMAISEVPTGMVADKYPRKTSIIVGECLISLFFLLLMFPTHISLLYLAFTLYGIGLSFISGSDESLIYESDPDNFQKQMGRFVAIMTLSMALASTLGGVLQQYGWYLVFGLAIFMKVLSIYVLKGLHAGAIDPTRHEGTSTLANLKVIWRLSFEVKRPMLASICLQTAASVLYVYAQVLFVSVGMKAGLSGLVLGLQSFLGLGLPPFVHYISQRLSANKVLKLSILSLTFLFTGFLFADHVIIVVIYLSINVLFYLVDIVLSDQIHGLLEDHYRASAISVISLFVTLLMSAFGLAFSYLSQYHFVKASFAGLALLCLLAFFLVKKTRSH